MAAKDLTKVDLSYPVALEEAAKFNAGAIQASNMVLGISYKNKFIALKKENFSELESLARAAVADGGTGVIAIKDESNGSVSTTTPTGGPLYSGYFGALNNWQVLGDQIKANEVIYKNVFQLDFNKFLKAKGGLRPLLQRVDTL